MATALQRPTRIKRHLTEQVAHPLSSSRVDRDACVIRGVKLSGRSSPNRHGLEGVSGTEYTRQAFESAIALYEGAKIKADHPPRTDPNRERSIGDTLGKVQNVAIREGEPYGDLHLLPSHPLTSRILDAAERMPDLFCLSHNADGVGRVENGKYIISEIVRVNSVDIVDRGATTRSLFESEDRMRVLEADLSGGLSNRNEDSAGRIAQRAIKQGTSTKHAARLLANGSKKIGMNPAHAFIHYVRSHGKDTPFAHFQEVAGHMGLGGEPKHRSAGDLDTSKLHKHLDKKYPLKESLEHIGVPGAKITRLFEMDLGLMPGMAVPEKQEEGATGDWRKSIGDAILGILADTNLDGNGMRDKIMKVLDALAEPVEAAPASLAPMGDAGGGGDDISEDDDTDDDGLDDVFGGDDDTDTDTDDEGEDDAPGDDDEDSDEDDDKELTMKESQELASLRREKKARQLCESLGWNSATGVEVKAVAALERAEEQKALIARLRGQEKQKAGPKASAHRNVQESKEHNDLVWA